MTAYTYSALDKEGKTKKGVLEADSARLLRERLRKEGLTPLETHPIKGKRSEQSNSITQSASSFLFKPLNRRIKLSELALVIRQIATLLEAGLPMDESLQAVIEQTEKKELKQILSGVRSRVLEGNSLADSMRQFPEAFPELYCSTVAAGEETGKLDLVLTRLADYAEQQQTMRQRVSQALIYPTMMTFISISIVIFLLIYVVPKIIHVFTSTGQTLPTATLILIDITYFLQTFGIYLLIAAIILGFIFIRLLKKEAVRERWDAFLLRIPFLGYAITTLNTARYARTCGILFAAGVPILETMKVAARLVTNLPMRKKIDRARLSVKEGIAINQALKQTRCFTPMTLHLIASGERSGRLEEMLERAAKNQENTLSRLIDTMLRLFEPFIILVMGIVVLFIVLAILLPIFQMDQFVG